MNQWNWGLVKKTFGASFILEQLVSMRVQKIFLFKSLVHFKIFRRNGVWRVTGVKLRNYFYIFREWIDGIFYAVSFKFRGHRVCLSWLILLGVNFTSWTNTVLLKEGQLFKQQKIPFPLQWKNICWYEPTKSYF